MAKTFNDQTFKCCKKNLETPKYQCEGNLHNRLSSHPTLRAIVKYRNHPIINIIRCFLLSFLSFHFLHVDKNFVLKKIKRLIDEKAI